VKKNRPSYRASSVFNARTSYSLPKKNRSRRPKRRRKYSRAISPSDNVTLSSGGDSDEELLNLRLQALTSKQEVKELIEIDDTSSSPVNQAPSSNSPHNVSLFQMPTEEEQLRIAALHSAVLKKKDHFKKLKRLRKMENERPYSPSDIFDPIHLEDAEELSPMDLELSTSPPMKSPISTHDDINQEEVDMDISLTPPPSSPTIFADEAAKIDDYDLPQDDRELIDMEIVSSPQHKVENNDDEDELRSMLLMSMNKQRKEKDDFEPDIAFNLKMAVERIKQQKQHPIIVTSKSKSGNKTIKMVLEEKKRKKVSGERSATNDMEVTISMNDDNSKISTDTQNQRNVDLNTNDSQHELSESALIRKIIDTTVQIPYEQPEKEPVVMPIVEDSVFSTITDTKNIPLLPQKILELKKRDKRLITSLESVIRPVTPLIINLNADSCSSDDDNNTAEIIIKGADNHGATSKTVKKTARKIIRLNQLSTNSNNNSAESSSKGENSFQKNLDYFLKNIRNQQEKIITQKDQKSSAFENNDNNALSAVKHLPLSSQKEYQKLLTKMKELQQIKKQRHQARVLKRTKSSSNCIEVDNFSQENCVTHEKPPEIKDSSKLPVPKILVPIAESVKKSKIDETLSKIPLLDEAARKRLVEKTEKNFINHR
jgi:hypothetical protein